MRRARGVVLASSMLIACGDGAAPSSLPPTGPYVFRLMPAASCGAPAAVFSFDVFAVFEDGRRPGVQIVLAGAPRDNPAASILEMELLHARPYVRGAVSTMHWNEEGAGGGARSKEGIHVWIQGIATMGRLAESAGRPPEVYGGYLLADLSFGRHEADRDGLGGETCFGQTHVWSLAAR